MFRNAKIQKNPAGISVSLKIQWILMCKLGLRFFANIAFFRLAQKYLVQILYFFAWPKST